MRYRLESGEAILWSPKCVRCGSEDIEREELPIDCAFEITILGLGRYRRFMHLGAPGCAACIRGRRYRAMPFKLLLFVLLAVLVGSLLWALPLPARVATWAAIIAFLGGLTLFLLFVDPVFDFVYAGTWAFLNPLGDRAYIWTRRPEVARSLSAHFDAIEAIYELPSGPASFELVGYGHALRPLGPYQVVLGDMPERVVIQRRADGRRRAFSFEPQAGQLSLRKLGVSGLGRDVSEYMRPSDHHGPWRVRAKGYEAPLLARWEVRSAAELDPADHVWISPEGGRVFVRAGSGGVVFKADGALDGRVEELRAVVEPIQGNSTRPANG